MKKNYKEKNSRQNKGITLIALIITIIVLLILAGVSILMLAGENGILKRAGESSETTKDVNEEEQVKLAVAEALTTGKGKLTKTELENSIGNMFGEAKKENLTGTGPWVYKGERGDYTIGTTGKITSGSSSSEDEQEANDSEGYVGYYADLDGNAENGAEGIIYADLAKGSDGLKKWNESDGGVFLYPPEERDDVTYKKYVLEEQQGSGFGEYKKEMIKVADNNGTERFYVMALEDVNKGTRYTWYKSKKDSLPEYKKVERSVNDFEQGKTNTEYWIGKWNEDKDDGKDNNDIWKIVQDNGELKKYGRNWFIPSKAEWSAFGYMCYTKIGMPKDDYELFGLGGAYWSSSLTAGKNVWVAMFLNTAFVDAVSSSGVDDACYVRMSTTF